MEAKINVFEIKHVKFRTDRFSIAPRRGTASRFLRVLTPGQWYVATSRSPWCPAVVTFLSSIQTQNTMANTMLALWHTIETGTRATIRIQLLFKRSMWTRKDKISRFKGIFLFLLRYLFSRIDFPPTVLHNFAGRNLDSLRSFAIIHACVCIFRESEIRRRPTPRSVVSRWKLFLALSFINNDG